MIFRWDMPFRYLAAQGRRCFGWFFDFETLVTDQEWGARRGQCDRCAELTNDDQCRLCGCLVDAKAMLALEKCPINRWKRIWRRKYVK